MVGPEEQCFYVHPSILAAHSEFLKSALKEEWTEGKDRVIKLPEDDPEIFYIYVQWLYTGTIFTKTKEEAHSFDHLVDLYLLGEKMLDQVFQNRVMDALVSATRERDENGKRYFHDDLCIDKLYRNTPKNALARQFMVDVWVRRGRSKWISEDTALINKEFLVDLTTAMLDKCELRHEFRLDYAVLQAGVPCKYHQHGESDRCESGAT